MYTYGALVIIFSGAFQEFRLLLNLLRKNQVGERKNHLVGLTDRQ